MSLVCSKKRNCDSLYKDKVLVVDSSSLIDIFTAIANKVSQSVSEERRFASFRWWLDPLLVKIQSCCFGAVLNVTSQVFDEEMDPVNPKSTLREDPKFEEICGAETDNYSQIRRLFQSTFRLFPLRSQRSEIQVLLNLASSGPYHIYNTPSRNDFSLVLLALRLSTNHETLLLTDDSELSNALENICATRYVRLSMHNIDTRRISSTSSLTYLHDLYGCCEVNTDVFWALVTVLWDFVETMKDASNPTYEARVKKLEQTVRTASSFNK